MKPSIRFFIALTLLSFALLPETQAVEPAAADTALTGGNTADGQGGLQSLTSGTFNSAFGFFSLLVLTDGDFNTGVGAGALLLNTAAENTATGAGALFSNSTGTQNTANGTFALFNNTASGNTAVGSNSLFSNTTGGTPVTLPPPFDVLPIGPNVAIGQQALESNTVGSSSVAVGYQALASFVEGAITPDTDLRPLGGSTAVGFQALANARGFINTAIGYQALFNTIGGTDVEGTENVAVGARALLGNETGTGNVAIGDFALQDNTEGSLNIALGTGAGGNVTTADGVICIGASGDDVDDTTWIANIFGATTINGSTLPVIVSQDGQLGTTASSARFKKDIQPMDSASETILALKPVKFHYKSDKTKTPQFGLVAEEVAAVNPDLVVRDKSGEIFSVRYDAVNAMLLNEFLKEHKKVEQLKNDFQATVAQQQKEIQALTAQIKDQAAQIQKVSAQVELKNPAPQTVANK